MMVKYKNKSKNIKMILCVIVILVINSLAEAQLFVAKIIAVFFFGYIVKLEWTKNGIPI